jgi:hypothetical protein
MLLKCDFDFQEKILKILKLLQKMFEIDKRLYQAFEER